MTTIEATIRCAAFGTDAADHRVSVGSDGSFRVYDAVANHYTLQHGLDADAEQAARVQVLQLITSRDECVRYGELLGAEPKFTGGREERAAREIGHTHASVRQMLAHVRAARIVVDGAEVSL